MVDVLLVLTSDDTTEACRKLLRLPTVPGIGWSLTEHSDLLGKVNEVRLVAGCSTAIAYIQVDDPDFWITQHGFEDLRDKLNA